jgi:WD40 repeat protein
MTGDRNGGVEIWDTSGTKPKSIYQYRVKAPHLLQDFGGVAPGGSKFGTYFIAQEDKGMVLKVPAGGSKPTVSDEVSAGTKAIGVGALSPDGKWVFFGRIDGQFIVHEIDTRSSVGFPLHKTTISSIALTPDGSKLITSSYDGRVIVADAKVVEETEKADPNQVTLR